MQTLKVGTCTIEKGLSVGFFWVVSVFTLTVEALDASESLVLIKRFDWLETYETFVHASNCLRINL